MILYERTGLLPMGALLVLLSIVAIAADMWRLPQTPDELGQSRYDWECRQRGTQGSCVMVEWLEQTITTLGYGGITALMFVANFIPFFPSDLIMPFAGFVVSRGKLSFAGVVIAGTLGSVAGQLPLYYLGRLIGQEQLKRWAARYGRWLSISPATIDRGQLWFDRYGEQAVLVCRLIPTVRALISIPAGIARMNLLRYMLYSTVGIGIWTILVTYLGQLLGENYARASGYLDTAAYLVLAGIIVVGIAWWIVKRRKQPSRLSGGREG